MLTLPLASFRVRVSTDGRGTWSLRNADGPGSIDVDAADMQMTWGDKAMADALYWNRPIDVWLVGDAVERAREAFGMNG